MNWAVDPARVAPHLPPEFVPEVRDGQAIVSAVAFVNDRFHFRFAPFVALSCGQVDYRTYVRHRDQPGIWSFGSSLDSRLVEVARLAFRMPWHAGRHAITASWEGEGEGAGAASTCWSLEATGEWSAARIVLRGDGRPFVPPSGLTDPEEASEVLLDPMVGWYPRRGDSGVGRYSVWHEPLTLESATVDEARCQPLESLDLVDAGQVPVAAGLQRTVPVFDVHTPPRRVRPGDDDRRRAPRR